MTPEEQEHRRVKRNNISRILFAIKKRADTFGIPFDLDLKYLAAIAPDLCPIFRIPLLWGYGEEHGKKGGPANHSPSLDRIIPELGYVKGNVAWISYHANRIKSSATDAELYAVANWLHVKTKEVLNGGGARPPSMDDPSNTYIVLPATPRIINDDKSKHYGGY